MAAEIHRFMSNEDILRALEDMDDWEKVSIHNTYRLDIINDPDAEIFPNDSEHINALFNTAWDFAYVVYHYDSSHDYWHFNGNGWVESFNDPEEFVDLGEIADYIYERKDEIESGIDYLNDYVTLDTEAEEILIREWVGYYFDCNEKEIMFLLEELVLMDTDFNVYECETLEEKQIWVKYNVDKIVDYIKNNIDDFIDRITTTFQ